ncbi:MAG TPA: hypothetical protein VFQ61_38965 [Polyangiaceae bacterium]|nr:hypothetical protein [Polyangiaceae bacterium]
MAASKKNVSGSARATIDHDEIREWVEAHGGHPAHVKSTARGKSSGILRIDFPGFSGEGALEPVEWEEFFEHFENSQLAFLYQDKTASGRPSNFNKLVKRDSVELTPSRTRKSSSRKSTGARAQASARKATPRKATARKGAARKAASRSSSTRSSSSVKKTSSRRGATGGSSTGRSASSGSSSGRASSRSKTGRKAGGQNQTGRRGAAGTRSGRSQSGKTARAPSQRDAPKRVAKKAGGSRARKTSKKK